MNDTVKNIRKHTEELEIVAKKGEELRKQLHEAIANLPDNPEVKRVAQKPRCFTVSSKAVFGDLKNNPTLRMDPFYHDFSNQYEAIAKAIDICEPINVLKTLTNIANTGKLKLSGGRYHSFHPVVVNHLRTLIGMPADFSLRTATA